MRYRNDQLIRGVTARATSKVASRIRRAIDRGVITFKTANVGKGYRLDHAAYEHYQDASLWWVIAAASGIGWGMQIPPGTRLVIPDDIEQVKLFI